MVGQISPIGHFFFADLWLSGVLENKIWSPIGFYGWWRGESSPQDINISVEI